jgi:hypothetical protein
VKKISRYKDSWQVRAVRYHQELKRRRHKCYYRCGSCGHRQVLPKELWEYTHNPNCKRCFNGNWYIDNWRYKQWRQKKGHYAICRCSAAHYTHRPKSIWNCIKNFQHLKRVEE